MKYFILFISALVFLSCDSDTDATVVEDKVEIETPKYTFTTLEQKISYCIGLDQGSSAKQYFNSPELKGKFRSFEVKKGMIDYLQGVDLRILPSQLDSIFDLYLIPTGVDSSMVSSFDASYAFGVQEGNTLVSSLVARGIDQKMNVDLLVAGIEDGMTNAKPSVSIKDARIEVVSYYSEINKVLGESFLAQNATREDIVVLESGLQYQIFKKGTGITPGLTDSVIVHYTGRFVDGREFESTVPSKIPAQLTPMSVIPGWNEGLQLMKEGGQYRFFIPFDLAYGEEGNSRMEPFTALVFDIELIKVKKHLPNQ
jgi:FKBP-type peptidyl-prolyl cis-trans isomerase FkpA